MSLGHADIGHSWHARVYARPLDGTDARAGRIFIHVNLVFCLLLQRFCINVGGGVLYWCLPVFLASLAWLLASGRARLNGFSMWTYGAFALFALVSTMIAVNTVDARINGLSLPSLASVLIVYLGLVVTPSARFDGSRVLGIFLIYARVLAACGIVQYLAQFAGFAVFAFGDVAPALGPVLAEPYFNSHPIVGYGASTMRSNGFFLLEPSIFSQILMLAVAIEVFVERRLWFLPLYGAAYVVTYSGTGILALAITCALAIVVAPRSAPRLLLLGAAGAIVAAAAAFVFPDAAANLLGRSNELSQTGSSGYARYLGQFKLLDAFGGETRTLIGFGPGAMDRAAISTAGSGNAALKLFFEYGVLGLAAFAIFLIGTLWRRDIAVVSLFLLVNYQLGGGYLLFMPLVILAAIICIWSDRVRIGQPLPAAGG